MFLEILLFIFLGVIFGTITGMIPGLHPNTLFIIILSSIPIYMFTGNIYILAFILSLAVSNTFIDFIPSIFFGAPEEDTTISIVPTHYFFLKGEGYHALFQTVYGGIVATLLLSIIFLPLIYFFKVVMKYIRSFMWFILSIFLLFMIIKSKNKTGALLISILSGSLGIVLLNSLSSNYSLFPSLTGMFGISILLLSSKKVNVKQRIKTSYNGSLKGGIAGLLAGILSGFLPAVGSSQTAAITSSFVGRDKKIFISALGGINTANIIVTMIIFHALGNIRSGAAWAISQIFYELPFNILFLSIPIILISASLSSIIALLFGKVICKIVNKINYFIVCRCMIAFLILIVFVFSGIIGILILVPSTIIGILCSRLKVERSVMMSYLLLPTILYYSNILYITLFLLTI